jgi:hypothetical protein
MAVLLVSLMMTAVNVTSDEARQKALLFLNGRTASARGQQLSALHLREVPVTDMLYVFNVGQRDGFVIVSGDDCTDAILGYSDTGEFPSVNIPDNLRSWLQGYADQIRWAAEHHVDGPATEERAQETVRKFVRSLLTCEWDQEAPYNNYCPFILYSNGFAPAVTGCVATAVAQIMYYHGLKGGAPTEMLKAIPAYQSTKTALFDSWANEEHTSYYTTYTVAEKPVRIFDWSKMSDYYPSSDEANEEVARLIEYVGAGVQTQYGISSSASTSHVPSMLVDYFGYDSDIKSVFRDDYSYTEWIDLIYHELVTNGPVLFGGQSVSGGHAFVVDGFSEDDFFHINWGWSGLSNGYYRLSALNPDSHGIGGGSLTDSFDFDQDIMINVKPVDDGVINVEDKILTVARWKMNYLSAIWYDSNYYYMDNNSLYSLQLDYTLVNNTGSVCDFDWGVALYQGDTFLKLLKSTANTFNNGMSYYGMTSGLSFGEKLQDGEYRIICVSRKTGTEEWYPCFDSDQFYVRATVSGDDMTFENVAQDRTPHLSATLELRGDAIVYSPVSVIAKISNTGYDYRGKIQLIRKSGENSYLLAARQVDVESGAEDKEYEISFVPYTVGEYELALWDKDNNPITGTSVVIEASAAPSSATGTLEIVSTELKNGVLGDINNPGEAYGSSVKGVVTVKNTSKTAHTSGIQLFLFKWTREGNSYSGQSLNGKTFDLKLNAGETSTLDFEIDGMEVGSSNPYSLYYYYTNHSRISNSGFFVSVNGIDTYAVNGTVTTVKETDNLTVASDVVAVDLTHAGDNMTVAPNGNPNTLYFIGNSLPAGLDGKNIIKNGVAEELTLSDDYPFFTPKNFTATKATYTRLFTNGADGSNGWTTIVLPFDVNEVKQGENTIDWFHSADDTDKNFWVKDFSSDAGDAVNFDYADKMEANTPYIIAVPGNRWGTKWDLTNKDITFIGDNVDVACDVSAVLSGNNFRFVGVMQPTAVADGYVMNAEGNAFEKTTADVSPFRAYFKASNICEATSIAIGSEDLNTSEIVDVEMPESVVDKAVFTLDGRQVKTMRKGIYVKNGKKIVK